MFLQLRKTGALDALRFVELRAIFRRWSDTAGRLYESPEQRDAAIYAPMMAVASAVLAPSCLKAILDPRHTFAWAYGQLESTVSAFVQPNPEIVTDRLWQLLRPAFLTVREQFGENPGQTGTDQHALPTPVISAVIINEVVRPLEPFSRFLDQLTTCDLDRWTDFTLRLYDWGPFSIAREDIRASSNTRVRYICVNGHRHAKFPKHMAIALRHGWTGCPYCSNSRVLAGYNSLAETHPALAAEWHPNRNGTIQPSEIFASGRSKYWWRCPVGHEYRESLRYRSSGGKCPYCSHRWVIPDETSLASVDPVLAREWHPTLNGSRTPSMIFPRSVYTAWWLCKRGHTFPATVRARRAGNGCPYCSNKKVLPGDNDLATTHPDLAKEWHPYLNGTITPRDVVAGAGRQIWWECPLHHIYRATLKMRVRGQGCPFCGHVRVMPGFNDLETKAPDIAAEWDGIRNGGLSPQDVGPGSRRKVWWSCPKGHAYEQTIQYRVGHRDRGYGCPYCSNKRLLPGDNDFQTRFPLLATEWHPTKNAPLTPSVIFPGDDRKWWWLCSHGHEKYENVPVRRKTQGCTQCPKGNRVMDKSTVHEIHPQAKH
ncbi:zinc-ribbon domain-containing protein [Arthrobacter sp. ISL-65]|uniref:zinc-ribbon domain-containing protein n=1 Tax=Arthrobacter sp. ISL-65 TaxID=2819112 RepID=UPI001BEC8959|nr:zinc-ribbon domain-containing protein [Arthrobacter sp. ISL-65]MBT2546759.1 zinc-ribbon domain-containing protein [Arthrobacter sp. ISL-65]